MKFKLLLVFFLSISLFAITTSNAQAPQGVNYQAVARNSGGSVLVDQNLTIQSSVISGTPTGTVQWMETFPVTTNKYGLFNIVIGQGTKSGGTQSAFSNIDWTSGNFYLKIEINLGAGFLDMGTTQLVSVPFALVANKVVSQPSLDNLTDVTTVGASNGQVLKFNGTSWEPGADNAGSGTYTGAGGINVNGTVISTKPLAGDVTGATTANTVGKIQGIGVSTTAPANGQVLKYNSGSGKWEPGADDNSGGTTYTQGNGISISGGIISNTGILTTTSAGGDLAGTYPNPIIAKLRGTLLSGAAPTSGQVLKFDGISNSWAPGTDNSGSTYTGSTTIDVTGASISAKDLIGDVTGTLVANTVEKIQGRSVSAAAPSNGQILQYNGGSSQWQPATLTLGQVGASVYGTSSLTVTASMTTFTLIPGLTQTINVPANAIVYVQSFGGMATTSVTSGGYSSTHVALFIDGAIPTEGAYQQLNALNNTVLGNAGTNWNIGQVIPLAAGSHTFEVRTKYSAGATATVSSDNVSVLQGVLTVMILKN